MLFVYLDKEKACCQTEIQVPFEQDLGIVTAGVSPQVFLLQDAVTHDLTHFLPHFLPIDPSY